MAKDIKTLCIGTEMSAAIVSRYLVSKVIYQIGKELNKRAAEIVHEVVDRVVEENLKDIKVEMFTHPITGHITVRFDVNTTPFSL